MKNKKGVSLLIGYTLLIIIAIVISILVYQWLKTYIPTEALECNEGVSIFVEDSHYNCSTNNLNLTIKNSGRFGISGYYIYGSNSSQTLATIDLSQYISLGDNGVIVFDDSGENAFLPGESIINVFNLSSGVGQVSSLDLVPSRYETINNRNQFLSCSNARITQQISCSSQTQTPVCGNSAIETGEQCDDSNSDSGDGCSSSCQIEEGYTCSGEPSTCILIAQCGDGNLDSGETCDDNNTIDGDGCSSTCQTETGYLCSGEPSICSGVGVLNATYSNLQKDTGSNPDSANCKPNQGCHWWYFDTTLQELGETTGITVENRQKCYDNANGHNCDPVRTDISAKFGTDQILAGGSITWEDNWIWTDTLPMTFTETFNGTDDNSNHMSASYSFTVTA